MFYKAYVLQKDNRQKGLAYINKALEIKPKREIYHFLKYKLEENRESSLESINDAIYFSSDRNRFVYLDEKYKFLHFRYGQDEALVFAKEIKDSLKSASRGTRSLLPLMSFIAINAKNSGDLKLACEMYFERYRRAGHDWDYDRMQAYSCSRYLKN